MTLIWAYWAYSPPADPSALSKTISMLAMPTGLRPLEPLKMTSAMDWPRSILADDSPMTQRTASMTLDLPQPFGPTIPTRLLGKGTVVGSTKDLNPASLIRSRRIGLEQVVHDTGCRSLGGGRALWLWRRALEATGSGPMSIRRNSSRTASSSTPSPLPLVSVPRFLSTPTLTMPLGMGRVALGLSFRASFMKSTHIPRPAWPPVSFLPSREKSSKPIQATVTKSF